MPPSPELAALLRFLARQAGLVPPWDAPSAEDAEAAPLDSARFHALLMEHQLAPLYFSRAAQAAPGEPAFTHEHRAEIGSAYYQSGRQAAQRRVVLQRALHLLRDAAEPVLLKGLAVAPLLYREAAERPMRDMDLLFASAAEQHRARDLLLTAGFTASLSYPAHHHLAPVHDPSGRISIELHDNITTPPLPRPFIEALWARRVRTPPGHAVLDPVGQFLHHALHVLKDPVDSPFLRDLFEVACLASRLDPGQRQDVADLAQAGDIAPLVARALRMAHEWFGSPSFLSAPPRGPYEGWCERRIEWTAPSTRGSRLLRHLARERFNRLCEFPEERNPVPWLGACSLGLLRRAGGIVGRFGPRRGVPLQRAPHAFIGIGSNTLIHDAATGEVHMLNEQATPVWSAAAEPRTRGQLLVDLCDKMAPADIDAAITALLQRGLLRPPEA